MEYVEKDGNIEREYKVVFDKARMWDVLHKVVRWGSYRVKGDFDLPDEGRHRVTVDNVGKKQTLPNGDPLYEDVEEIFDYTSNSMCSYHNDTTAVKGVKVCAPKLAYLIRRLIDGVPCSIYDFINYEMDEELIPIEEKIIKANEKVNGIDNFDYDEKVKALGELKELANKANNGEYYNTEYLREWYDEAYDLLNLSLVRETKTGFKSKVKLRTFEQRKSGK